MSRALALADNVTRKEGSLGLDWIGLDELIDELSPQLAETLIIMPPFGASGSW